MKRFLCLKDWKIGSGIYFEKGKWYSGIVINNGKRVKIYGEVGITVTFNETTDYFNLGAGVKEHG